MRTTRRITGPRTKGPAPSEAGANLLVHDLKNLAGRLSMLGQNLDLNYDDPLFKTSALALLEDTVRHLKQLVTDIRERGSRIVVKLRVDVNQVVSAALLDTRPDLVGRVEVRKELDDVLPVWGDAYLLRLAFGRAIENALEAMHGRGVLALRTGLRRRPGATRVLVEIEDNGPGMSDDFLRERFFQPFSSTKNDGLGLGVYSIRQVVGLHGGNLRVKSTLGAGTRVRVHLPAEES